jgi:hypothetical protein
MRIGKGDFIEGLLDQITEIVEQIPDDDREFDYALEYAQQLKDELVTILEQYQD